MRALSDADLLSLWESGRALHSLDQGLLAIHTAFPERANAADWPIGERNHILAEMHCALFGDVLEGWTGCPECGEKLEFRMDGRALAQHPLPAQTGAVEIEEEKFRLPTSRDLARLVSESRGEAKTDGAARLLTLCRMEEENTHEREWTESEIDAVGEKMAAADPLAEIMLHFACPTCKSACEETLHLAAFFWAELEALARRLALEIHTLATAYGWSEREILSLSEPRRRLYLEMVQA